MSNVIPCPTSGTISIDTIRAAFPSFSSRKSIGEFNGVKWYRSNNSRGIFVAGAGSPLAFSAFYDTREISPVFPNSVPDYTNPGTVLFTVPVFNKLYIRCVGGGGGSAGANGLYFNGPNNAEVNQFGFPGGNGSPSSFGSYLTASGGVGGNSITGGAGAGETTVITLDIDVNPDYFNLYGTQISVTVGGGGIAGTGGMNRLWRTELNPDRYVDWYRSGNGSAGANGSVRISWT